MTQFPGMIPDDSVPGDELLAQTDRLEAALERIAAARPRPPVLPGTDIRAVAARLDTTIARLRAAIDEA
jgi:hypothetical protein